MKKRNKIFDINLRIGELYLFHTDNPYCPSSSSLWGVYDKRSNHNVYLESSTLDLYHFRIWHKLPKCYRYCRCATRVELRDYMYNIGFHDARMV